MLTKSEAKALRHMDYIPNGKKVDIRKLHFRETEEHEVFFCAAQTGNDIQSGPIYCGDVADWISHTQDGGVACLCNRHANRYRIKKVT